MGRGYQNAAPFPLRLRVPGKDLRIFSVVGIHLDLMAKRLDGNLGLLGRHVEMGERRRSRNEKGAG